MAGFGGMAGFGKSSAIATPQQIYDYNYQDLVNRHLAPPLAAPAAPQGGQNITTSITPQGVYSPESTQAATNQQMADISARNGLRTLLHSTDRPGVSRSASSIAAVMPDIADARAQSGYSQQAIPFGDAAKNAQNMLQGQQNRAGEFMGLAGASLGQQQNVFQQQQGNYQALMHALGLFGLGG